MDDAKHFPTIAAELNVRPGQVERTIELLDAENTVPFIARYRKEVTGNLDEEQIRAIEDGIRVARVLDARKETVLASIDKQGKLTPELKAKIEAAQKLQEVEDLYLPYKPKRRTRATIAKEKGLEPLAEKMLALEIDMDDFDAFVESFIDEEKGVNSAAEALAGARDICAEAVSDNADVRKDVREISEQEGMIVSEAKKTEDIGNYEMYADFSQLAKDIQPYRTLAINRGERENVLRVKINVPEEDCISKIEHRYLTNEVSPFYDHLKMAISDSYYRLISPSIEREIRHALTEVADEHAIEIFAKNLRAILLQPPVHGGAMLGIDPGYRTGSKVAAIDSTGKFLEGITIYPHAPQKQWEEAKATVKRMCEKHNATIMCIGNGTASRETEAMAIEIIDEVKDVDLSYIIVSEAGASVYSASKLAKEEFPDLDVSMRGAISIARRLLDPLSELVKIDPKSIGVGLYQHDVNQSHLNEMLDRVVESCVNMVGVDLNTASKALLRYVAGVNSRVAENIIKLRDEKGKFTSRNDLLDVKGMGENAFTQAAGFLRIPNADYLFDSTAVHPESYSAAEKMLQLLDLNPVTVKTNGSILRRKMREKKLSVEALAQQCDIGLPTLEDIIDSLEKPNRDPRDELPKPILRQDVLKMEDLQEGMVLQGTVRNVVDFGAFVDIGVKTDGLVHKSQLSKKFVKNPLDVVSVGNIVRVKILSINAAAGRIGLSMVLDD